MNGKKKILIVEDEIALIQVLSDKLTHEGYAVLRANNGLEGLKVSLKEHPDLILLDIFMPKMDGMGMLDELRKDAYGKSARVIVLTNLEPDDTMLKNFLKNKPAYYFVKSEIKLDDVLKKIKELLVG